MTDIMKFGEYSAVVNFDPEIKMFRGEFIDIDGGGDFYAKNVENLHKEGEISLRVLLNSLKTIEITNK